MFFRGSEILPLDERTVLACTVGERCYSDDPPFHPSIRFPESCFPELSRAPNPSYDAVRLCFQFAGLDAQHFGTSDWNPLGDLIQPGEVVLLKPNLITDSSFDEITQVLGLSALRDFYSAQGLRFELVDLRQEEWNNKGGVIVERRKRPGDPRGRIAFDLGDHSEFLSHEGEGRYYGADYDAGEVNRHHSDGRHEYLIAASAIECDVVFSLPKLKTHKKAGITVSLKNLVGINADKNWLPHHTEGGPAGDEHPTGDRKHLLERWVAGYLRELSLRVPGLGPWVHRQARKFGRHVFGDTEDVVRSGNWWGNDTVWRMCLDLNKVLFYGTPDGTLRAPRPENRKRRSARQGPATF